MGQKPIIFVAVVPFIDVKRIGMSNLLKQTDKLRDRDRDFLLKGKARYS